MSRERDAKGKNPQETEAKRAGDHSWRCQGRQMLWDAVNMKAKRTESSSERSAKRKRYQEKGFSTHSCLYKHSMSHLWPLARNAWPTETFPPGILRIGSWRSDNSSCHAWVWFPVSEIRSEPATSANSHRTPMIFKLSHAVKLDHGSCVTRLGARVAPRRIVCEMHPMWFGS